MRAVVIFSKRCTSLGAAEMHEKKQHFDFSPALFVRVFMPNIVVKINNF